MDRYRKFSRDNDRFDDFLKHYGVYGGMLSILEWIEEHDNNKEESIALAHRCLLSAMKEYTGNTDEQVQEIYDRLKTVQE